MSRPATVVVLTWVMTYFAIRDASGFILTMHEVSWLSHPTELTLLLVRGLSAAAAAWGLWGVRRWGMGLTGAWLLGFGLVEPALWWPVDPYATLRGAWVVAVPALLPWLWAWRRVTWDAPPQAPPSPSAPPETP